jgi:polyisoprenyl-phosphate glycosyltransferase
MTGRKIEAVDIIVPLYNEEQAAHSFHLRLASMASSLPFKVLIHYVNDGSTDGTADVLEAIAARDDRVVIVELSRNFGHQAALTAGLDVAQGDVVVTMDGDGQHPPDLVPEMLKLFEHGYDVVLTRRCDVRQPTFLKRWTSEGFYSLISRISDTKIIPGCADYRLMSRQVVDAVKQMPEYHRFVRGMVAWLGYRTVILPYAEQPRIAGGSKYSFRRMVKLATDAISSFSLVPLRIGIGIGFSFFVLALLEVGYVLNFWLRGEQHLLVPGWSSLMFAILLVGGFLMVTVGIIGSYVGYIFQEVKRRPVYVVRSMRYSRQSGQAVQGDRALPQTEPDTQAM